MRALLYTRIIIITVSVFLMSCAYFSEEEGVVGDSKPNKIDRPLVDEKYSLKADREQFNEIRKDIPQDRARENDELALILQDMNEGTKYPGDIREKFNKIMSKKREVFNKDMTKSREAYTKEERKRKEAFLKTLEVERTEFKSKKVTPDERREFFEQLEKKRQDFFAAEREARSEYDSDQREKRSNFDDYVREKSNNFNQELRAYEKRYQEIQKQKKSNQDL